MGQIRETLLLDFDHQIQIPGTAFRLTPHFDAAFVRR